MRAVKRCVRPLLWRRCGALLVLCLLLPLVACLCAHDDCTAAPCAASDCACINHGFIGVTSDAISLAPSGWFDRALPPASPKRALLLPSAIFRPPIA